VSTEQKVQDHFHADAKRFDAIYEEAKDPFSRFVDNVWRGVVRRRFDLTLRKLEPLQGKTVLDVGCGSGRYGIAFAQHGAARVVGVDFAPAMIEIANDLARKAGLQDRCEFRVGAFPDVVPDGPFDISCGLGFFDYIARPAEIVRAMRQKTKSTMVMSFPKSSEWRAPLRRVRFLVAGCPLFLYSERQTRDVLAEAGVQNYEWIPLDRDYIVVAHL
jgi:cyclopropane fatty-acyl-phospholipid synthase-like methyltransferase